MSKAVARKILSCGFLLRTYVIIKHANMIHPFTMHSRGVYYGAIIDIGYTAVNMTQLYITSFRAMIEILKNDIP